jgi:hypothetical protein
MWAAGAVCFFGAWGRGGLPVSHVDGMQNVTDAFSLNLIAGLIGVMIICDIVIVNPVIRMISGKRIFDNEKKGIMFVLSLPLNIVKVTVLMLLVVCTYYYLNIVFIHLFSLDKEFVPVPLEPILFGIFYGLYWLLFEITGKYIILLRRKNDDEKPVYHEHHFKDE